MIFGCCSQPIPYSHLLDTPPRWCLSTSTLRRMIFSALATVTVRFVSGVLINTRAPVCPRLQTNLSWFFCSQTLLQLFWSTWLLDVQGGMAQVRFQPRIGQLLAAAANDVVSVFDFETDRQTHLLKVPIYISLEWKGALNLSKRKLYIYVPRVWQTF